MPKKNLKKIIIGLVILITLLIIFYSINFIAPIKKIFTKPETFNGILEATTIKLSAQIPGIIDVLNIKEGDFVTANSIIGYINREKLDVQLNQATTEYKFYKNLLGKTRQMLKTGAATAQSADELNTKVKVLKSTIQGINLQIKDAAIKSPIQGSIINKYLSQGEFVFMGSLIAEVADLKNLEAYIYIPLNKLNTIKINQQVQISTDGINEKIPGKIIWLSAQAEFTPKTILTKETRTSLVYAAKIALKNETEKLKIGMPIDVELMSY